jgi:hypothetical protein
VLAYVPYLRFLGGDMAEASRYSSQKELVGKVIKELHSLAALLVRIEAQLGENDIDPTADVGHLAVELVRGLELTHQLAISLSQTALTLHVDGLLRHH